MSLLHVSLTHSMTQFHIFQMYHIVQSLRAVATDPCFVREKVSFCAPFRYTFSFCTLTLAICQYCIYIDRLFCAFCRSYSKHQRLILFLQLIQLVISFHPILFHFRIPVRALVFRRQMGLSQRTRRHVPPVVSQRSDYFRRWHGPCHCCHFPNQFPVFLPLNLSFQTFQTERRRVSSGNWKFSERTLGTKSRGNWRVSVDKSKGTLEIMICLLG